MAQTRIVYIEASTGNRWNLPEFPQRVGTQAYSIEFLPLYEFDKTPLVEKALKRSPKPDVVVLQECSVYFPGPLDEYQERFQGWIDQLKAAGVQPVIATVVPPARSKGFVQDTKDFIKVRVLGRESQYDQVVAFNRWLRVLAEEEGVPLLDLEAALRVSDEDRYMRPQYNAGDGIHLNPEAYRKLDQVLLRTLTRLSGSTTAQHDERA